MILFTPAFYDLKVKKGCSSRFRGQWLCVALLFLALLWPCAWAQQEPVPRSRVQTLQVYSDADGVYVDAQMDLHLPPVVQDALHKGVVLYFVSTVSIVRGRWYWFDAVDVQVAREVRLSFQPMLQRYRVSISGLAQTFNTLPEALSLVGSILRWRIANADVVSGSQNQTLIFSFELDQSRLPRIFRLSISGDNDWKIRLVQEVDLKLPRPERD